MKLTKKILLSGVGAVALMGAWAGGAQAGAIFITGHDSDEHDNSGYMGAGLDFLFFGGPPTDSSDRANRSVAYLSVNDPLPSGLATAGYTDTTSYDASTDISGAFSGGHDAIMVGSGSTSDAHTELLDHESDFTTFFNDGGALYINTDEGFGQSWYDFVPSFGSTQNNTISTSGAFTVTSAGATIGLTEPIVDEDITHSFYTDVDTSLFTVFETTDPQFFSDPAHPLPVAFGSSDLTIGGGGEFEGGDTQVPEPATLGMFGIGLAGLGFAAARRRKTA